jgi:hypothetical protein
MSQPVSFVRTIAAVAEMLGENEELLWELSDEMDKYDGKIWVLGALGKETRAFTPDGIERLRELLEEHEENPNELLLRNQRNR